jgi:putative sigma-54 modulation protein
MKDVSIVSHHVSISAAMKDYVEKKLGKIDKFFGDIQKIEVDLDVREVSAKSDRHQVKATIWASGAVFRAEESAEDMYAAVDLLIDKLEKQLRRYNDKVRDHNLRGENTEAKMHYLRKEPTSSPKSKASKTRRYVPRPMHPEDAAAILTTEHLSFLMFRNAATEEINVVYVDEDGELDLVEP